MNGMTLTLVISLTAITANAIPKPKPEERHYKFRVQHLIEKQAELPDDPVYVGPAVKRAGAYKFEEGMTLADLIEAAGGLDLGEFALKKLSRKYPAAISMYRPTEKNPDPDMPRWTCSLDLRKPPSYGLEKCNQQIERKDLIYVPVIRDYLLP